MKAGRSGQNSNDSSNGEKKMTSNTVKNETILVINPGSTSTKLALYDGEKEQHSVTACHSAEELALFGTINEQLPMRKEAVRQFIKQCGISLADIAAIAARGGVIGALESGAYRIDAALADASYTTTIPHPSNLAPVIGYQLAQEAEQEAQTGISAYMYDAVCGCGTPDKLFLYSGVPELDRVFLTHVLNSRAVAVEQAKRDGVRLEEMTYIVTHMGGGITSNLLKGGKILDIVADDEGTFSPERSGGVPCRKLVRLCYSGKYSEEEMQRLLKGQGGLAAYLGTNELPEIERRIDNGDHKAEQALQAMALQISKDIASLSAVVCGEIDKIILTGGLAFSAKFVAMLQQRVQFLAEVAVIAGSFEMEALALGVLRILRGEEEARIFQK